MIAFLLSNWRLVLMALLLAAAAFYRWQAHSWEDKYETYVAEVRAAGLVAEAKAKETEAAQAKATKEIKVNAKRDRDRIALYYERRLLDNASGSEVSRAAGTAGGPDAAPAEPVASGPGFERACALDAQQVMAFQAWARAQGIPVR